MLAQLQNPFLSICLDDTTKLPAGNVPELHATALEKCTSLLTQAGQAKQSVGLLVVGEAGVGKSHMIAQLRQQLSAIPSTVLAAVRLRGAYAGGLWRHVRKLLADELLRPYPSPTLGANGLVRILRNCFPKWESNSQASSGTLFTTILGRSSRGSLQPFLDEFVRQNPLDSQFQKVLSKLGNPDLEPLAHTWLKGVQLGEEDLQKLGLPPIFPSEQEQESSAREVVRSFLRLAGDQTVLLLCFDEIEAIQAGTYDPAVLRQFATLATELVAEPGPRVVATFIRPTTLLDVTKAVEVSNQQKLFQFQMTLPPITWEQSVRVVVSRLEAEPTCRALRQSHSEDVYWPLGREFLETEFTKHKRSMTPRHLIRTCAVEFQRLQKGVPSGRPIVQVEDINVAVFDETAEPENSINGDTDPTATNDPPPKSRGDERRPATDGLLKSEGKNGRRPSPDPAPKSDVAKAGEDIARMWEKQRKKLRDKLQGITFDSVMSIGLPWLVKLTESPLERMHDVDPRLGDVNLVFRPTVRNRKPIGICFCNHEPRQLWRRLDKVMKQWQTARDSILGSLVILRFDPWPDTDAIDARRTALYQAGVRVVLIEPQQLAEFAAFQMLLTAALSGDLTRAGLPVEASEYDAWARNNLSASVKEFLDQLFGLPAAPKPAPTKATEAPAPPAKKSASPKARK